MNVYFSASIAGGRKYLQTYQQMVEHIKKLGHYIPSEHIVLPDVLKYKKEHSAEDIYTRDIEWVKESDAMVAEVSNPSLGVGYEICYALRLKKPVLCLYQKGLFISRMITGNTSTGMSVVEYSHPEEWQQSIKEFLNPTHNQ